MAYLKRIDKKKKIKYNYKAFSQTILSKNTNKKGNAYG